MQSSPAQPKQLLIGSFLVTFLVSLVLAGVAAFMIQKASEPIVAVLDVRQTAAGTVEPLEISVWWLQSIFWIAILIAWVGIAFRWYRRFRQRRKSSEF